MVMMQSPSSDTPKSASPLNSMPCSPNNPHAKTTAIDQQLIKFEPIVIERPLPTKFDGLILGGFHHDKDIDIDMKHRPLTYPKDMCDIEANTKYSLERLKQLSNRTLYNRHSPSDDSNHSPKYPIGAKVIDASPKGKKAEHDPNPSNVSLSHKSLHVGVPTMLPTQFAIGNPLDMDIERLKLARHVTNGKEFTDFGFRIQLGEFHSDYAQSDTSEELVVDEKSEIMPFRGDSTTVCSIYLCDLSVISPFLYGWYGGGDWLSLGDDRGSWSWHVCYQTRPNGLCIYPMQLTPVDFKCCFIKLSRIANTMPSTHVVILQIWSIFIWMVLTFIDREVLPL